MARILVAWSTLALKKRKQSSANKMWDIIGALLQILTPLILPLASAFRISGERPSTQIINKCGDSGSPYLEPLPGMIWLVALPLTSTKQSIVSTHIIIHLTRWSENPIFDVQLVTSMKCIFIELSHTCTILVLNQGITLITFYFKTRVNDSSISCYLFSLFCSTLYLLLFFFTQLLLFL